MYEDLVKALRCCPDDNIPCKACPRCARCTKDRNMNSLFSEAADAIDELDTLLDGVRADNDALCEIIEKLSKPRWIPVTERLPEKDGKYLVCGRWRGKPTEIWVCECITLGPVKGWVDKASNPVISHWMPLPSTEGLDET